MNTILISDNIHKQGQQGYTAILLYAFLLHERGGIGTAYLRCKLHKGQSYIRTEW